MAMFFGSDIALVVGGVWASHVYPVRPGRSHSSSKASKSPIGRVIAALAGLTTKACAVDLTPLLIAAIGKQITKKTEPTAVAARATGLTRATSATMAAPPPSAARTEVVDASSIADRVMATTILGMTAGTTCVFI